ncbi:four and a half LIM domains protein 3-like [Hippocampus comes]|uniref:four and a half LIM domains protein 3-like n=1 Tax=Hippocampus comes TaxID=109280 RepID=UPI00094E051C|nr:PREDICTED: four and a half LIM domains protein 3-like [Hippocampus comes]
MSDRFDCKNCHESLYGRKYIQVEDNPHCIPCYDHLYANTCQECKEIITHNSKMTLEENDHKHFRLSSVAGSKMLEYSGSTWHEDCFVCHGCEKPIGAEAFIPAENNYYCVPCYEGRLAPRCSHCNKALTKGGVTYRDEVWHKECFVCTGCKTTLAGQPFTSEGENPYCVKCFSSLYAKKCAGCNTAALKCVFDLQALTKGGVTYRDEVWHKECFVCTGCKTTLAGQPFTSEGENPYCVKCFSSLYAKKCAGCNTAITGFGDGKYISFEERQWHQPCFKCSRCSVSLVGSGFFPDRDQILCTDCNNDD